MKTWHWIVIAAVAYAAWRSMSRSMDMIVIGRLPQFGTSGLLYTGTSSSKTLQQATAQLPAPSIGETPGAGMGG